mgnify:FL=1
MQELLDMGLSLLTVHSDGSLYCDSKKHVFVTVHKDDMLLYFRAKNPKCYRYKKLSKGDFKTIQETIKTLSGPRRP